MTELSYVPKAEFERLQASSLSAIEKAEIFSTLCRINVLYMIAYAGSGHIGTSFSSLDIVSWLFLNQLKLPSSKIKKEDADVYFSSKGHDAPAKYAILTALGLLDFELIHTLRRLNGLPGHPDVSVPFMHANTGSLGMGISKARGMALARRLEKRQGHFYVLTGDGELQEGQFWESLSPTVNRDMAEITVIVDHNKVQSDILVEKTSSLGDLEKKLQAFDWHVQRIDGHDFNQLNDALAKAKAVSRPKIIIADTVKGKGVSFMEHTAMEEMDYYKFHSGAPSDADYERGLNELKERANALLGKGGMKLLKLEKRPHPGRKNFDDCQRLVGAYSRALLSVAEKTPNLVAMDADLVLDTGLIPFKEKYPQRYFECGIAEQDMVSQAGGMALEGLLPVVHSFACFLSDRPNEQIFNNATELTKVIYVGSLAGLLPSGPGHSHQCVRDVAAVSSVPRLICFEPSCEREVEMAVDYLVNKTDENSYLRLVSIPVPIPFDLPADYKLQEGRGVKLTSGDDAVLISYGPVMLSQAYRAAMLLKESNFGLTVINLPWLNRVDEQWLSEVLAKHKLLITLDNHFIKGGQGEYIASVIPSLGLSSLEDVLKLGLTEIPKCGQNDEVLQAHKLDAPSIAARILAASQSRLSLAAASK